MIKKLLYRILFSLLLTGCAGDPVRVDLPATHPADRRAQETEFWTIPNPFAGTSEVASAVSPTGESDTITPDGASSPGHGHPSTGSERSMPEDHGAVQESESPHHMEHEP